MKNIELQVHNSKSIPKTEINSGFTLVEIIIAIAIIALFVFIPVFAYGNVMKKSRDTQRKKDIQTIQLALETYKDKKSRYPVEVQWEQLLVDERFLSSVLKDPRNGEIVSAEDGLVYGYSYTPSEDLSYYMLSAVLEETGKDGARIVYTANPAGVKSMTIAPGGIMPGLVTARNPIITLIPSITLRQPGSGGGGTIIVDPTSSLPTTAPITIAIPSTVANTPTTGPSPTRTPTMGMFVVMQEATNPVKQYRYEYTGTGWSNRRILPSSYNKSTFFVRTDSGLYMSTPDRGYLYEDDGLNFTGVISIPQGSGIYSIGEEPTTGGIMISSSNHGQQPYLFTKYNQQLEPTPYLRQVQKPVGLSKYTVYSSIVYRNKLYSWFLFEKKIMRYDNPGWTEVGFFENGIPDGGPGIPGNFVVLNNKLYFGNMQEVYEYESDMNWKVVGYPYGGNTSYLSYNECMVNYLIVFNNTLFATSSTGLDSGCSGRGNNVVSKWDGGTTWTAVGTWKNQIGVQFSGMAVHNNELYLAQTLPSQTLYRISTSGQTSFVALPPGTLNSLQNIEK